MAGGRGRGRAAWPQRRPANGMRGGDGDRRGAGEVLGGWRGGRAGFSGRRPARLPGPEEEALEATFGFHNYIEGEPRLGWLINFGPVSKSRNARCTAMDKDVPSRPKGAPLQVTAVMIAVPRCLYTYLGSFCVLLQSSMRHRETGETLSCINLYFMCQVKLSVSRAWRAPLSGPTGSLICFVDLRMLSTLLSTVPTVPPRGSQCTDSSPGAGVGLKSHKS